MTNNKKFDLGLGPHDYDAENENQGALSTAHSQNKLPFCSICERYIYWFDIKG
jgi:hypothetical protein